MAMLGDFSSIKEIPTGKKNIWLYLKLPYQHHPYVSGNKFWKLFYIIKRFGDQSDEIPSFLTFGGAYSNHVAAVASLGRSFGVKTVGIIRGEELEDKVQENPTLRNAVENGMLLFFLTREEYRYKEFFMIQLKPLFPNLVIIPEGGTNADAIEGIQYMLDSTTRSFDYLCTAVGTGGTVAGLSKYAEAHQRVLGFKVVADQSLHSKVLTLSKKENFKLIEAHEGGYGKISDGNVRFINDFSERFGIQLDPIYTGKMMSKIFTLIEEDYFPENSSILAFHTGGLQGIEGANQMLKKQNRELIRVLK